LPLTVPLFVTKHPHACQQSAYNKVHLFTEIVELSLLSIIIQIQWFVGTTNLPFLESKHIYVNLRGRVLILIQHS